MSTSTFPPVLLEKPEPSRPAGRRTNADFLPPDLRAPDAPDVEARTQEIGRKLLRDVQTQEGRGGGPLDWAYEQVLGIATADDDTKVQLFRFTDALPALKTDEAVVRHLREYLLESGAKLPPGASSALKILAGSGVGRRFVAWASQFGASQMAARFIAGANAREATSAITRLRRQNMTFTLDLLGEAVTSEAEAIVYQAKYIDLVRDLSAIAQNWKPNERTDRAAWGDLPKVNVSVKLSSLYARFDPMAADATTDAVKERLRPILRLARANNVFVNFDMEQHDFCAITQRIFMEIFTESEFADWQNVGIVSQAYLRRAEGDIKVLRDWVRNKRSGVPVTVRLVKGAYWDYETIISAQRGHDVPVYSRKAETDACFERVTTFLIENSDVLRPAIATHNVRSAAHALAVAEANRVTPGTMEFQVLFGMGEPIGRALAATRGERVRVYVPFGELLPGMAYLVRRLLENTSNDSFIRKAGGAQLDAAKLLAAPGVLPIGVAASYNGSSRNGHGKTNGVAAAASVAEVAVAPDPQTFRNEPETDFAEPMYQEKMRAALATVKVELGVVVPVVVGGKSFAEESELVSRADPSDDSRVVSRAMFATTEQAARAVELANGAFPGWRDTPVAARAKMLHKIADYFAAHRFEIAAWMTFEVGKPWREADGDVAEAIDFCRFYANEMVRITDETRRRNVPGEWNETMYEPRGVCVVIAPWNFPLAILTGMATAALVAGNPVILKPAEQSPRIGYFLFEALRAAGCPANVAHFLPGDGEIIGPTLVNSPHVATIAFTGSRPVGLSIIENAAIVRDGQREVKRVIAEMGGKNAIIVDSDADLDEAVLGVLHSTIGFAGQKCSACSRVIVIGDAYEPFCERLAHAVKTINIGRADDPATTLGPVVDADSVARVHHYIEIGNQEGKLLAMQPVPDGLEGAGNFVPCAVFADCPPAGRLCQEEIFGPVLAIVQARNLDEALQIADNTPYALTGGLYSRSPRSIERVRYSFRVGNLYINRKITGALVDRQPFGGARMSGVGSKAGGGDYLLQFLVPRTITESVMRRGFAPAVEGGI